MIRFSVIIPTLNRPQRLAACLQSFTGLDYPGDAWELIVVNDGGERSFAALTPALLEELPLTLLNVKHGGPARARNAGEKIARGEFLAFTDDDCLVESGWLQAFEVGFSELPCAALGGQTLNPYPRNIPAETWSHYMDYVRQVLMRDTDDNLLLLLSNNAAYRRAVFNTLGGFDETFPLAAAEDTEFGYRLVGSGYRQEYYPAARVWHHHKNTYWGYLKQQIRYGRGDYYYRRAQNSHDYPRISQEKATFCSNMRRLWAFADSIHAPLSMRSLLLSTPFAFKAGFNFEQFSNRTQH
nr:glycosyltransferase [Anaerolineae bacterium]